jgi:CheY-like chemotaxis protein
MRQLVRPLIKFGAVNFRIHEPSSCGGSANNTGSPVLRQKQNLQQPASVKTVLIADDSASVRLSVRLLLQGRHRELVVREAFDGMDAVEKAKKSKPDLILLDLAMPRLNGAEAATVLKNDSPETPVILFTYTDLHAGSLCAAIGVDFISKTDGIPKLLERVDALLPPVLPNEGATLW